MFKHPCIKCREQYDTDDPDPYYCASCNEGRKAIAAEIDAKLANRPRKETMSALEAYDQAPKIKGFMYVKL